jgi:hypothetical protein
MSTTHQYHYPPQNYDEGWDSYHYEEEAHSAAYVPADKNQSNEPDEDYNTSEGLLCEEEVSFFSDDLQQWHEDETVEIYLEEAKLITPGTKEICRACMNARYQKEERTKFANQRVEVKLDSCGSVSIANSALLTSIKTCKEYRIPSVSLKGIGGKTEPLTKAGILKHVLPNGRIVRWLCYVFDIPVGHSKQLLLLSMSAIKLSNIDLNFHID